MTHVLVALLAIPFAEIDISATVEPLSRLLPQIGSKASLKLSADASVAEDVVGIASPKRPIRELMDGIAEAVNATWSERKDSWVLTRTKAQDLEDQSRDAMSRAKWLKDSLETISLKEPFEQQQATALAAYRYEFKSKVEMGSSDYSQLTLLNGRSPMGRFGRRLIEAIGLEAFSKIPSGKRTVLSSRPNAMQKPLGIKDLATLIESVQREQNLYADAVKAKGEPAGHTGTYVSGFDYVRDIPADWDRVLVVVDTNNPWQIFTTVRLLDKDGKVLVSAKPAVNRNAGMQPIEPMPNMPEIALSPLSKQYIESVPKQQPVPEEVTAYYADPATQEPLGLVHTESIAAWSAYAKKPVIVYLNDQLAKSWLTMPYKLDQYIRTLGVNMATDADSEKWVISRPLEPFASRLRRTNRRGLSEYIRSYKAKGFATLESLIRLSVATSEWRASTITWFLNLAGVDYRDPYQIGMLRLLALAEPAQRNALLEGATVSLSDLSPAQRTCAHDLIFNAESLNVTTAGQRSLRQSELTEAYPNGLPETTLLKTTLTNFEAVRFKATSLKTGSAREFMPCTNAEALASFFNQDPANAPKEFQFGRVRQIDVLLLLEDSHGMQSEYQEQAIPKVTPWVAFSALPEAFRREVQAAIERWKKPPPPTTP